MPTLKFPSPVNTLAVRSVSVRGGITRPVCVGLRGGGEVRMSGWQRKEYGASVRKDGEDKEIGREGRGG